MNRKIALLLLAFVLPLAGCDKIPGLKNLGKKKPIAEAATTAPVPEATPILSLIHI